MNSMVPKVVFKTRVHDKSLGGDNPFAMFQWSKQLQVLKVKMLQDGNADFTGDGHAGEEAKSWLW